MFLSPNAYGNILTVAGIKVFVVGLGSNAYTLANFEIKGVDVSPL